MATSCTNDFELQDEGDWAKLCTLWGTPSAKVRNMMKTYTQLSSSSGVIVYKGKNDSDVVSYKFVNDSLCASMVVMKSDITSISEIRKSFDNYESLGEYNANELFVNGKELVTIKKYLQNDMEYIVVGYVPFQSHN